MKYKNVGKIVNALGQENILAVDFNPKKTCNFDCIYCGVGRTDKWLNERKSFFNEKEIFEEIKHFLTNNTEVRGLMLTGSGEPALYKNFGELAKLLSESFPDLLLMAYTNISLLHLQDVQDDFKYCHILGCNLNSVYDNEFRKICRPMSEVNLEQALKGLKHFSQSFKGQLLIDTKFAYGLNDTKRNVQGLVKYLAKIQPNNYVVFAKKTNGKELTQEFIEYVKEAMKNVPFPIKIHL